MIFQEFIYNLAIYKTQKPIEFIISECETYKNNIIGLDNNNGKQIAMLHQYDAYVFNYFTKHIPNVPILFLKYCIFMFDCFGMHKKYFVFKDENHLLNLNDRLKFFDLMCVKYVIKICDIAHIYIGFYKQLIFILYSQTFFNITVLESKIAITNYANKHF